MTDRQVAEGVVARLERALGALFGVRGDAALVGRNSGWMLGDRAARLSIGLVVNAWLVRYLGAEQLGLLSFAQSIVVITAVASQLGLETILVRDLVRQPESDLEILGTALRMRVIGWLATLGLAAATAACLRPGDARAMTLTLVCSLTALAQTFDIVETWFQSRTRVAPVVAARMSAFLAGAVAKVIAIATHARLETIALILSVEALASSAALVVAYVRSGGTPRRWRAAATRARGLLRDAWPLMLNSVALVISVRVDQMILTTMRGTGENGIYAAAQRLAEILYFVPAAVIAAANPVLLRSHQRDAVEYKRRLQRVFSVLAVGGLLIAVVVSLGAPLIVRILFGPAFRASAPVLAIQAWSCPPLFLGVAQTNWFIAEGRQRGLLLRSALAAAASVALNLALVPTMGARGAALTMLISQTVAQLLFNAVDPSTRGLFRMQCRALVPFLR
ncbi:MAG: flippase [Candidatus Eisenbacteria bacterium]